MAASPIGLNWSVLQRSQRTIVVVDVVESVRLIEKDELDVIDRWRHFVNEVVNEVLPPHKGRLVKSLGDGLMLEFAEVLPAIQASLDMHRRIAVYNADRPADTAIHLRVGAHVADIVVDELDVYGAGVNLAARLTTLAGPDDIVVSAEVRDQLVPGLDADVEDLGECYIKHLAQPVRAYRLGPVQSVPRRVTVSAAQPQAPLLAVIPFASLSLGDDLSIIGDAIAGDLTAAFSRVHSLRVISQLSARAFQHRTLDPASVRSVLNADYVLSGSCGGSGEQLVVRTELTDVRNGELVWADTLHGDAKAILFGISEVVSRIIDQVAAEIVAHEVVRAAERDVHNLESYTLLLGAVHLMHRLSRSQFDRARALLEALAERMPRLASTYGWLAKWHVLRVWQGWAESRDLEARLARDAIKHALDADPSCSIALVIDGMVHTHLLRRFDIGEQRYAEALAANPNDSLAWLLTGTLHAFRGEGERAVFDVSHASALSPLDPLRYFFDALAATASLSAGRYEDAIALAERSLKLNRTHSSTLRALTIAQVELGRIDDARATAGLLLQNEPGLTIGKYLERTPARDFPIGARWARALAAAGVPR